MIRLLSIILLTLSLGACGLNEMRKATPSAKGDAVLIDHKVRNLHGEELSLASLRGKALLVVNTASECGFTPQYAGLETLHERFKDRGLVVLGFPCNDFGGQEPGDAKQIEQFCSGTFHVTFQLLEKIHAKGDEIAPLYQTLTTQTPEGIRGAIKWNFTKFLVDPAGHVVARFEPGVDPLDPRVLAEVEKVLPPPVQAARK